MDIEKEIRNSNIKSISVLLFNLVYIIYCSLFIKNKYIVCIERVLFFIDQLVYIIYFLSRSLILNRISDRIECMEANNELNDDSYNKYNNHIGNISGYSFIIEFIVIAVHCLFDVFIYEDSIILAIAMRVLAAIICSSCILLIFASAIIEKYILELISKGDKNNET